ncbi:hypothetical protein GCM10023259_056380 [Thermocatellispora tengchongensis]
MPITTIYLHGMPNAFKSSLLDQGGSAPRRRTAGRRPHEPDRPAAGHAAWGPVPPAPPGPHGRNPAARQPDPPPTQPHPPTMDAPPPHMIILNALSLQGPRVILTSYRREG